MSEFDTAIWIEATDDILVNALSVQFFEVQAVQWEIEPGLTVDRWGLCAQWADGFVTLRRYDTEDAAQAGLLRLRKLLPGQHISADLDLEGEG